MIGQAVKVIVRLMRLHSSEHKEEVFLPVVTTMICATMLITHLKHHTLFLHNQHTAIISLLVLIVRGVTRMHQLLQWLMCLHHRDLTIDTHQDRSTILMASHHLDRPIIAISISLLAQMLMSITTLCRLLVFTHLSYITLMPCNHVIRQISQ